MSIQLNAPVNAPRGILATVIYNGSDAVCEGEPFAYDVAAGTAANPDGNRHNRVVRPTASSAVFAGVAARSYPADSGNRQIDIYLPGSRGVRILAKETTALGDKFAFCYKASTGSKVFKKNAGGTAGPGYAICRQAVTVSDAPLLVQADLVLVPEAAPVSES